MKNLYSYILGLFCLIQTITNAQTVIYQQNFDGNNGNYSNTIVSQAGTNGWVASSTAAQYGNYRHVWNFSNVTNGGNANVLPISGRSLGMGFYNGNNPNVTNQFFRTWDGTTCNAIPTTTRWAHVGLSTVGYENITVEFKWRCLGEVDGGIVYDYGTINTSIDGGSTWLMDQTGGQGGTTGAHGTFTGGLYYGNSGVQTTTLTLPATRNNQANFRLAFRMVVDECYGTGGGFIVDDIIVRGTPLATDRTLTVAGAYTGATYANGPHVLANNASVTATAGTRPGFSVSGWTGTGSVPATGSTGSTTFTISQNSSITWNWVSQTETGAPVFFNKGGSEQLTFNNSRLNDDTPTFRLSHAINPATNYQINIQDNATFSGGGQTFTETFNGTFAQNTEANFAMTNTAGQLISGKTYYVRARTSGDSGNSYSAWSTALYSFTYESTAALAHWFQTTQAQLATSTTSGVTANATNSLELTSSGGNVINNGSFESGITGWTVTRPGTWYTVASEPYGNSDGTNALNIYNNNPGSFGYLSGDAAGAYQTVNLTGVNNISFTGGYEATNGSALIVQCRVYVSETTQTGATAGTLIHTWTPSSVVSMGNVFNIDISSYGFTGNKLLKFIFYVTSQEITFNERYLYIDNVQALASPSGTAISTAFELASVYGATNYDKIEWNQTLNGGAVAMKLQSSANGTTWADVAGYTSITYTGDGLKTHDISGITATAYLRAVATLSGATGVLMNDWALYAKEPCEAMITLATPAENSICANTSTTITAVANNPTHEIRWYSAETGGSILQTGDTFTTPNLTATTTYYVSAFDGTCESDVRTAVIINVNQVPSSVTVAIGTPANGATHNIAVSYPAIAGATQYQIDYSWDNAIWNVGGFSTTTTYNLNLNDNPNRQVFVRVKRYDNGGLPDCFAYATPIYTAADTPNVLVLSNPTGTSIQVTIQAETPVANPAITTYSLYNETLGLYVQADGSLAATEVFQTKAAWGTITVFGLTAETEYCFYAKARNEDGDVRFTPAQTLFPTQEFNSNVLTTGTGASTWFAPNSNPPFVYSTGGCNGGRVGYANNTTTTWGNFLRIPAQNLTGMTEVTLGFTLSNSYNAANTTGNFIYLNYWDTAYRSTSVTSIKIDGVPYTATGTTGGKINFDQVRDCANVEITFSLNQANDLSQVFFYFNAAKANVNGYSFYIDDITMANGNSFSSPDSVCLTTGSGCTAEIISTTNGSGCADILLLAEGTLNTTEFRWYDAEINGNLLETTTTGEWTTPVLTQTTTYYVSSYNDECESDRVAVTATYTPTDAEMIFTEGAAACEPGNVTLWAETSNDGIYTINWYDEETGGNLVHTGYTYTVNLAQSTSFYVAAVDGGCESERIEIAAVINAKTWNGSQNTDWNTAANWTPTGVPTAAHCVVIPDVTNAPVISGGNEGFAKSLTLLENASLLVESNATITVAENVTLAIDEITGETTADFTLENNGYLVQTQNTSSNNNNGKITVNKSSTPMFRLEATGWASPVEDQKLYDFAVGTVFGRVYYYDETTNAFSTNGITSESVFEPGQGYSVRAPNTFNPYTESATPTIFEGLFYGKPNNGDISINVTANNLGYNYVGNPYPSPIDAAEFLSSNSNVASLYFWTHEAPPIGGVYMANNYASFTSMGGTMAAAGGEEPDGIIQVGQGFVIKTSQQYLLQFTNDLRIPNSNGQFFRNNTEKHRMWLNLSDNTTNYNQILVGYVENASMGADHQIDAKMFGYSGNAIYSLIENEKYVIQGRSLPFNNNDTVPIGFKATNAGNFTISISKKDGLFENEQFIYLKDLALNITHNLSESAYNFLTEAGTFENRFEIMYQNEPLSVSQPGTNNNDWIVYKYPNSQTLTIESKGFEINEVEIFDLTGRLLLNKKNVNASSFTCQNNFADQVLLIKLNKTLIKKIL